MARRVDVLIDTLGATDATVTWSGDTYTYDQLLVLILPSTAASGTNSVWAQDESATSIGSALVTSATVASGTTDFACSIGTGVAAGKSLPVPKKTKVSAVPGSGGKVRLVIHGIVET